MQQVLRLVATALAVVGLAYIGGIVSAQAPKQIKLSEKQIEGFIAAHKDVTETLEKMNAETSEEEMQKQLDAVARKFGFKDAAEYELVVGNIDIIMLGLDPETKAFTDPPSLIKEDIEAAKADKTLSEKEKKQVVEELTEELKMAQPIEHPANIELVKKYYDRLAPLQQ